MEASEVQAIPKSEKQQINNKTMNIVRAISESVAGRSSSKKHFIFTKKHVQRYLYTFAFEIGCDVPSQQMIRGIYNLLLGNQQTLVEKQGVDEHHFYLMVKICLGVYEQAKKTAIGGIFQRVQMAIKQALYYNKLQNLCQGS